MSVSVMVVAVAAAARLKYRRCTRCYRPFPVPNSRAAGFLNAASGIALARREQRVSTRVRYKVYTTRGCSSVSGSHNSFTRDRAGEWTRPFGAHRAKLFP
ncbi:hypothetical protein JCM4914_31470 [Streptomyces platensis subsp. malvinus]